jgi:hypothetical protein
VGVRAVLSRSLTSYQFQAAEYVEHHNPHASVTFEFASCSGAVISDLYKTEFSGALQPFLRRLPPQIEQVARAIKRPFSFGGGPPQRKVDAAIVSIGVNNLGFGPLLVYCLTHAALFDPCHKHFVDVVRDHRGAVDRFEGSNGKGSKTIETWIEQFLGQLPARYGPLAQAISRPLSTASGDPGLGLAPGGVLLTQYPDFTRGTNGHLCSGRLGPQSTWATIELDAASLNSIVARAARAHHWNVVPISQDLFTGPPVGHGYCAADSYFRLLVDALSQGDKPGAFHPTVTSAYTSASDRGPTSISPMTASFSAALFGALLLRFGLVKGAKSGEGAKEPGRGFVPVGQSLVRDCRSPRRGLPHLEHATTPPVGNEVPGALSDVQGGTQPKRSPCLRERNARTDPTDREVGGRGQRQHDPAADAAAVVAGQRPEQRTRRIRDPDSRSPRRGRARRYRDVLAG